MTRFDIDMGKCMYCGICVESCPVPAQAPGDAEPTKCIRMTREFEGATSEFSSLTFRFIRPGDSVAAYKPQEGRGAGDAQARGAIARDVRRRAQWDNPLAFRWSLAQQAGGVVAELTRQDTVLARAEELRRESRGNELECGHDAKAASRRCSRQALAQDRLRKLRLADLPRLRRRHASGQGARVRQCEPGGAQSTRDMNLLLQSAQRCGARRSRGASDRHDAEASPMTPSAFFFYLLAAVVVVSAAGVALARNILYSAFALLGTLAGVAGLYLYMGADFLGIAQLLIYVGGILVLILFAVLLTNRIGEMRITNAIGRAHRGRAAGAWRSWRCACASPCARPGRRPRPSRRRLTARLGEAFLKEWLLPFELASLVLLMALVGAMVIARRAAKAQARMTRTALHIGLSHFLVVSAILFALGLLTVATRRNAVAILMGVELILNAAALNFVAFSHYVAGAVGGQVFALFIIVLAAAEAAIALAIVLAHLPPLPLHRRERRVDAARLTWTPAGSS